MAIVTGYLWHVAAMGTTNAEPQDAPPLLRTDAAGVATLTMNRPRQMNLLTSAMLEALQSALDAIGRDASVRVVVLAGAGKGFCAGHDLKEIRALGDRPAIARLFAQCSRMMQAISALPQPVIARVHGAAAAAGCQLVAQCDLAVASAVATFTTPGVNWGFFCSTPGVAVGRNLHRKHALEMLLVGDEIDAPQALAWGLVNRVVPPEQLDAAVAALAAKLVAKPRETVAAGKRAFYQQMDLGVGAAYELASGVIADSLAGEEGREGMSAFLEKRPPRRK
jgi:enoyl-CoA hydratase/carnithine racemase